MSKLFIDIGGTTLRSLIQNDYEEISSYKIDLIEYIEEKIKKYKINYVAISFAGQVSNGKILSAPNIKIKTNEIKKYFESKYNIKLKIENDLKAALIAESKYFNENNIALLFVGTGIGASVMENGKIIRGISNLSTEIGHIPFKKAPFLCGCGNFNCIENFTSGTALKKWANFYKISHKTIEELKNSNVKTEKDIYDNFIEGLLRATGTIITVFNPKLLVLGGGIIKNNYFLLDIIRKNIKFYTLKQSCNNVSFEISKLNNASFEGAKLL